MIYDSLDTIPCKVFFKIVDTGDFSLLTDDKDVKESELKEIWERLEEEHQEEMGDNKSDRMLGIFKRLHLLSGEYTIIKAIVRYLWENKNQEFIDKLKDFGYEVDMDNYQDSLKKIDQQASGLLVKIERLKKRMPDPEKQKKGKVNIDQSIYGYASVAEISISDTNKVTMSQYYAIKNLGEQRLKAMKGNKSDKSK